MFGPHPNATVRVLHLGAGVQSTTLALMAAHGEFDIMPDAAIFADTGAEPAPVYKHLEWLSSGVLPFPVHVVRKGNLYKDLKNVVNSTGQRFASIPMFIRQPNGDRGIGQRQCTKEYKIEPLSRGTRELVLQPLGYTDKRNRAKRGVIAETWIGISLDEAVRMKPSRTKWQYHRFPLIERRITRWDCKLWLKRNGYMIPPRSACTFCPFRRNDEWLWLYENDPAGYKQAIEVDEIIRADAAAYHYQGVPYLHDSLVPLRQVDLSTAEERGQELLPWGDECEGMCGV